MPRIILLLIAFPYLINAESRIDSDSLPAKTRLEDHVRLTVISSPNNSDTTEVSLGIFGSSTGTVNYLAFSSLFNHTRNNARYVQLAGIGNFAGDTTTGVQIAGIVNKTGTLQNGVQTGGICNIVNGNITGMQIAGLTNYAADTMTGLQIAGLYNQSVNVIRGSQISGFLNVAKKVEGNQTGFINVSDSIYGIPVGFLSYSRNGYHKFELSANELFAVNIAFHTGVPAFHNIFTAGVRPQQGDKLLWYAGYGVGTAMPAGKKFRLLLNITGNHISEGDLMEKLNLSTKAFLGVEYTLAKKFSLVTGPELNAWMTKTNYALYPDIFSNTKPKVFFNESSRTEKLNTKMWIGWKFGMRFF
jgi:hypothetical protein